jgi:diacylglycerol kinase family enzyme
MSLLIIVNPAAGSGKALQAAEDVKQTAKALGFGFAVKETVCVGDGRVVAAKLREMEGAKKPSAVISVGGDGTVQEIAAGMIDSGINIPLGIIPAGSGNDLFSSMSGAPPKKDISGVIARVLGTLKNSIESVKTADIIEVKYKDENRNEVTNYCVNIASMGIDAEIVRRAQGFKKIFRSKAYVAATVVTSLLYKSGEMTVTADGVKDAMLGNLLTAVCNGPYYGGGFKISPAARVDDGILSLCRIVPMPKLKVLALFPRVIKGTHVSMKEITFTDVKSVGFEFDGLNRLNLDGNLLPAREYVTFTVLPNALRVVV